MPEVELTGQQTQEVATKPSPAPLQKHSLSDCISDVHARDELRSLSGAYQ